MICVCPQNTTSLLLLLLLEKEQEVVELDPSSVYEELFAWAVFQIVSSKQGIRGTAERQLLATIKHIQ